MTRLFLKVGSDTLGSIQTRILKTFELIRESFPIEDQFNVIMRLLSDQTQTLNTKVKIAILQYLSKLIFLMDSLDFTFNRNNTREIQSSLMKIISWTADIKSSDLRKISQETIVDLYNLNSTEFTFYIKNLPKTYQDASLQIIQHKRKTRPSPAPDIMQTPYKIKNFYNANKVNYYDETENLNPDEIYDSLKKTSDEIQKYSFNLDSENLPSPNNFANNSYTNNVQKSYKKLDHLSSASLDSGISQIDGVKNSPISVLNEASPNVSKASSNLASISVQNSHNNHTNDITNNSFASPPTTNGYSIESLIKNFQSNSLDSDNYPHRLLTIIQLVQESSPAEVSSKYRDVYKSLLEALDSESNSQTKMLILQAISQIVHKSSFDEFIEPTLLRLLEAAKDAEKDVVKAAEETANFAVSNFDACKCFLLLKPYINSSESALSIASIKMLTKVTDCVTLLAYFLTLVLLFVVG